MKPHGNPEMPASAGGGSDSSSSAPTEAPTETIGTAPLSPTQTPQTPQTPQSQPTQSQGHRNAWALWEVFVRSSRGLSHVHAGSLHAPDAAMARRNARDL